MLKSISAQAPVAVDAGRDEVAVERLDRERAHPQEVGRAGRGREVAVGERRERGDRRGAARPSGMRASSAST